jgi:hypothetical protein
MEGEMGGARSTHGKDKKHKILVGKPEGNRPHRRCRHRQEDVRMDLRE